LDKEVVKLVDTKLFNRGLVVLGLVLFLGVFSGQVFPLSSAEGKLVLADEQPPANPNNNPEEFIVGVTPGYYSPRFNGSFEKYDVTR